MLLGVQLNHTSNLLLHLVQPDPFTDCMVAQFCCRPVAAGVVEQQDVIVT